MQQDPRFLEGEQFRATVVRQAILLGFSAEQYETGNHHENGKAGGAFRWEATVTLRWRFWHEGIRRDAYASEYTAALEYLRLINFPREKIGRINHGR